MANEQAQRSVTISRKDLYERVWKTPMSRLGAEYGISGNGLTKMCDRLNIPYPGRGYWARKEAGQKVAQYRLPDPAEDTPSEITISATPPPPPPPQLPKAIEEKLASAIQESADVTVSERLVRPHSIIAGWIAERDRRRKEAKRDRNAWGSVAVPEFTDVDHRRHRILDSLFKALEKRDFKIKAAQHGQVYLETGRERIDFDLREKNRQIRRPLTADEKRWGIFNDRPWRQELQPTGLLVFSIKTYLEPGIKQEWIDKGEATIESKLSEIVSILLLAEPLLVERRRQREADEKRRHEQERLRYEAQLRQKCDDNRWQHFIDLAHGWKEAKVAREFLAEVETRLADKNIVLGDRTSSDWVMWAHERINARDPLASKAEAIFEDISTITSWTYRDQPREEKFWNE
jgi:hypothetical protein